MTASEGSPIYSHAVSGKFARLLSILFLISQLPKLVGWNGGRIVATAATIAIIALLYLSQDAFHSTRRALSAHCRWLLFLLALAYIVVPIVQYASFELNTFDTAIFANQIAVFWKTGSYFSSVLERPALGEHWTPLLMLLAPVVNEHTSILILLSIKVAVFFWSALLLRNIAKILVPGAEDWIVIPLYLFFANKYLSVLASGEFQPSNLAMPFILHAFRAAILGRYGRMWVWSLVLLGFKEHLSFLLISLGLFLIAESNFRQVSMTAARTRHGVLLVTAGILSGFLTYFYLMPFFAHGVPPSHSDRFSPAALLGWKAKYVITLLASVGFLPLFSPRTLIWFLPSCAISLVSGHELMVTLAHHYHDVAMPVLFVASLKAIQEISNYVATQKFLSDYARYGVATMLGVVLLVNSKSVAGTIVSELPTQRDIALLAEIDRLSLDSLNKTIPFWTLGSIGPYFYAHPHLRSILDGKAVLSNAAHQVVILAEDVNPWPLSVKDVAELEAKLPRHGFTRSNQFQNLQVWTRTK